MLCHCHYRTVIQNFVFLIIEQDAVLLHYPTHYIFSSVITAAFNCLLFASFAAPQDLRFVVRAVHDVADKWEGIALCLRVKNIDKIKKDYRGAGKRMIAVLSAWLRGQTLDDEPPSWKKVVWVVADRVGGDNPAHAERILLNYDNLSQYTPSAMAAEADSSPFVQRGVSKEDIKSKATDLQKELGEVEHRWYQLGVLLGLPVHTLDGYQESYDDISERQHAMLQEWLQKGYTEGYEVPSRQVLVDAVEHSAGGENPRLAAKLAAKRVGGTPDTAAGSTSTSAGALVSPVKSSAQQSSAQQSTPLTSGQPPSMHQAPPSQLGQQQSTHQVPLSYQGQQLQMPITSQFQQPIVAGVPQMLLQPGNQYPPQQGTLKPTERQLMIELHNTVANNWRPIGTFLEIPIGELNTIAERECGDPQRCLMDMLGVWLRRLNPPASWPDIAEAVEFTGRPDIAQQIRQKYCMSRMQPQPAGPVYNQPTMYSAQQHMPQPQPYVQTQGQPFQQPQFSASTTYSQLQQPGQQWYGMPQQNVTVQAPQQMQPTGQPQIPPGMYAQQFYFQPAPQVPMQQQQQARNHPIPQQQQNVPHAQQLFPGSAQVGHLPEQPPQSQPQQVSVPPQSSISQTSPTDGATSAKESGTQTPEYQKLQGNFDKVIHHLGAILSAEDLADKLFANRLITNGTREEASLSTVANTKKIRALIVAVLALVQFDPTKYKTFVTVLSTISGAEHMADFLRL